MEEKQPIIQFDFDHWSSVAKENPEKFEAMREALLEQMIEQSPDNIRRRMEGLQWRIDQVRNRSDTPMAACLRISKMMWNSVLGEHGLLTALETPEKILKPMTKDSGEKIIALKKPDEPKAS